MLLQHGRPVETAGDANPPASPRVSGPHPMFSAWTAYGIAVALPVLLTALLLTRALELFLRPTHMLLLYGVVGAAAWWRGLVVGTASAGVAALGATWLLARDVRADGLSPTALALHFVVFLLVAGLAHRIAAAVRVTRHRLEEQTQLLQDQTVELEQQVEQSQTLSEELEEANARLIEVNAALEVARDRVTAILERITDAFVAIDADWRYIYVNRTAEQLLRTPRDQLLGRNVWEVFPDAADMRPRLEAAMRGQSPHSFEQYYAPFDTWFEVVMYPTQDGLTAFFRDVTERRKTEEALRYHQSLLEAQNDLTREGVLVVGSDGQMISFNRRFVELWGIPEDVVASRSDDAALQAVESKVVDARRFLDRVRYLYTHPDEPSDDEIQLTDGRVLHRYSTPIRGRDGAQYGRVWFFQDITEVRRTETMQRFLLDTGAALASSLDFEATLATVARMATPTLADWCIVYLVAENGEVRRAAIGAADPVKEALLRELPEQLPFEHLPPSPVLRALRGDPTAMGDDAEDALVELLSRGARPGLATALAPRGYIVTPLAVRGEVIGAILFVAAESARQYGPTDLALAEAMAFRASLAIDNARLYRSAREANRAKTDFLATMSHELRTPLNAIAGYVELLELGIRGPVTTEQRDDLGRIQRSQKHLLGLINDILNFAKIESGHLELLITDTPLDATLAALAELIEPQVGMKGLTYEYRPCARSIAVRADCEKLEQIVLNLLSNAVKFTASGGRIVLETRADADEVTILVHDTGCGIPSDKLERIFEPFVQVERRLTNTSEGAGLGLAISRDLARLMEGDLVAASVVGKGSTFTLTLPRGRDLVQALPLLGDRERSASHSEHGHA